MSHIAFHIENRVLPRLQPGAAVLPVNAPAHHPEVIMLNHMLANPSKN